MSRHRIPIVGQRTGHASSQAPPQRQRRRPISRLRLLLAVALTAGVAVVVPAAAPVSLAVTDPTPDFEVIGSDLEFIFDQIRISEYHAEAWLQAAPADRADTSPLCESYGHPTLPPDTSGTCVPHPLLPWGLRTVDGSFNNLLPGRSHFGAADQLMARQLPIDLRDGEPIPAGAPGGAPGTPTSYAQTAADAFVYDSQPRVASNLIVDLTTNNPAAEAVATQLADVGATIDGDGRIFIPNRAPDEGLSAPFNAWMTFFGQFFDHGLDLVNKGGSGTVVTPLLADDPLIGHPQMTAPYLLLTRATNQPGADGILGTEDDVHEHTNQTTPFIDQNQTYTSHPSHQVFLREYRLEGGVPVSTGRLLDGATGGLATWNDVKAQAQTLLGITLTDMDVLNVPEVETDPYGNFVPGPDGRPVLTGATTGHAFLDDIAHSAVPSVPGYDAALLGDHFITGDGRGNENIGLTAVHHVFHAEHNRLFDHIEDVLNQPANAGLLDRFVNEGGTERWSYGERLFQAARFVTEMEYQHGVFEEFGRTIQPFIDVLPANETGYHTDINAAITAEFAHVVYRFGHSMLTETLPRQGFGTADMSLLDGFLNPRAFLDDGNGNPLTPEQAAGSLAMGLTHHAGSGIDEFVTETLRNELLGLPLDLATINLMRGRDAGVPSFQTARATFYAATGDADLEPFANWQDFGFSMKHPESLVNFIAAYGTHPSIVAATTNADKRAAAAALVAADDPFLREPAATSGLNDVDFWIGGLAESIIPFGGMLGATFNFVFESQMEKLQNGDRFYYLSRNIGLNLLHQLEANSFSGMILRTTDATNIPADIFQTPGATIQLPSSDPDVIVENHADAPAAVNPAWASGHRYIGEEHVTIHGTGGDDRFRGGIGDDSLWGFGGDDHIVGGVGANSIVGGTGNDLLFGMGGDDNIKGGGGNDAIHGGSGEDLILGGSGSDFVFHGSEFTTTFGGLGDDFVLGSNGTSGGFLTGNEGDDWLEGQRGSQLLSGDNSNGFQNDPNGGHDVMLGGPGNDDMDSEGGDDIMVASEGSDRFEGMFGFDWVTYRGVAVPAVADMQNIVFQPPDVTNFRSRFDLVEGLSGWDDDDILRGYRRIDDVTLQDGTGHELTQEHLSRIANLRTLLGGGADPPHAGTFMVANPDSNIILGGAGSDIIEGRGGDNFIDGSAWLNVQLEWNGSRYDSMNDLLSGVFAGEIDPGDISIVREIVLDADQPDTINTAVFRDPEENYTITENDDGTTTVAHNGDFGTDTLRNIQRLQFGPAEAPEIIGLPLEVPPVNSPATGQPVIVGTAVENEELTVDTSAIADADGVSTFTFEWQVQDVDTGDWVTPASGNAGGPTFTPTFQEVGQNIRVVVSFLDGFVPPVNESVTSSAIGPVVACVGVGCGAPPVAPPAGDPPPPPPAPAPAPPAPPAPPASGPVVTTPLSTFTPLVPGRFLDTRSANATLDGLFSGSGTVPSNTIIEVQIAGRGNVPADATAVSMSVTAVTPSAAGFATVFPCGTPPNASNLNFADGQTVANSVTSLLSGSGSVCIFTSATSHFLIDVNGVVPPQEYTALVPGRFLDTRAGGSTIDGAAVGAGVVPAGTIVEVDIAGRGAVPADATAVSMNVTAVEAGAAGFATVFPCGTPPNASNINFTTGQTVANSVFTSLSTSGSVCIFTSAAAHYLIDVNGVFPATSTYVGTAPARFLDTRVGGSTLDGVGAGGGQVAAGTSIEIQVAGRGLVPPGATIASLNVTAVSPAAAGFATVYPCGTVPNASNLNVAAGQTVANGAMAMLSATGTVCIYTDVQAHYLVDVNGYVPG